MLSQPLAEKEWETDGQGRGLEMLGWGSRFCGAGAGGGAGDMTITSSSASSHLSHGEAGRPDVDKMYFLLR